MARRWLLCAALTLALCGSALAQKKAVPLVIQGDTVVVVKILPCRVVAPPGADFYLWNFPDSVSASEESDGVLTITKAPKGTFKVKVVTAKFDFDAKKVIKDKGEIEVVIGGTPPGPDPVPPPVPVDPLVKALKAAYDSESAPDRAESLSNLRAVYSAGAKLVRGGTVATAGQLWNALKAGTEAARVAGKLKLVQQVAFDEVLSKLPSKSSDKIDDSNRDRVAGAFDKLALALAELEKKENGK